jgi:putative tryptophan/tyrosine transport system substrate-binding protein
MNRRTFIGRVASSLLAVPLAARAQKPAMPVIGFLGALSAADWANQVAALRAGLREFGYVDGKNIAIEFRWAEGNYDRLPELARELVRLNVDVLIAYGTPATRAAKQATTTVPIVMNSGDAVEMGFVASLNRPGGNITGTTQFGPEILAKRLELLKEAVPSVTHLGLLANPANPSRARRDWNRWRRLPGY